MKSLQVLQGGGDVWQHMALRVGMPDLAAVPYRPGEMPTITLLALDDDARQVLGHRVRAVPLPAELWLRISVEAERHLNRAVLLSGVDRARLIERITDSTTVTNSASPMSGHRHRLYAKAIREAAKQRGTGVVVEREISVRIPEELLAAWSYQSVVENRSLDEWVSDHLVNSVSGTWAWEATAADNGQSLAELIYSVALSSATGH
jgi:hypothetical protein